MLFLMVIDFRPVPPRQQSKTVFDSKDKILRSILLCLRDNSPDDSPDIASVRALRIRNELYGSHVV